jgi:serine/threonine protein kinase
MIHHDIKHANILAVVTEGRLVNVLLADFGEAKQVTRTMHVWTMAGSPIYMAPEMWDEELRKGPKADVFSAGVVMIEMSARSTPNPGPETRREGGRRMMVPEEERRAADLERVRHPVILELAARCIVDDDEQRADAAEI